MKKLLPIALLIFFFSCCHKDPVPVVRLIPDELRAYWDFKPGTWWAYKDSVTGAIDTVKVTDRVNYTFEGKLSYNNATATCEYLKITTYNTGDEYTYDYWISTDYAGSKYENSNVVFSSKHKPGDFVDTHRCFKYPIIIGDWTFTGYGSVTATDTCIIRNTFSLFKNYSSVVQVDNTFNSFEGYANTETYFAKSIGIIQYNVPDSNRFKSLISYFIQP